MKENNDDGPAAEVMQTTVYCASVAAKRPLISLFDLLFAKDFVGSGMEAPRPLQDAGGTRQTSDNQESKPREEKKSLDRKISFNPGTADPDSALGGATEAGGSHPTFLIFLMSSLGLHSLLRVKWRKITSRRSQEKRVQEIAQGYNLPCLRQGV